MTPSLQELQDRITELEIKASFSDDLLEQLNRQIYLQQCQIERLAQELARLHHKVQDTPSTGFRSLRDDIPPHY